MQQFNRYYFCDNRKCSHTECLRHITNAEFNTVIRRKHFECTDKKQKDMLLTRPDKEEIVDTTIKRPRKVSKK